MGANRTSGYPATLVSETPPSSATERGAEAFWRWRRRAARRRPRRPRVALVTPWPPDRSGVADYNRRLTAALAERVDVDVVTARSRDGYATPTEQGIRLVAAGGHDRFARSPRWDRVVYCMGNSRFHAHVFELLDGGHADAVVFHDVQLTGFFGSIAGDERPEDPARALADRMLAMYPDLAVVALAPEGTPQFARPVFMTRGIQRTAEHCFVHSQAALDMLALDRDPLDRNAPATILPYALPDVADDARVRAQASSAPLIVSLGIVAEVKGIAKLISAFAVLAREHPKARLIIAGEPAEPADATRWHNYALEHAPGTNIEIPGRVSDARYAALLREADVAVQLRLVSNGEASSATGDSLAAGIPTLVADLGWAGELPADAVALVPLDADAALIASRLDELLVDSSKRAAMSAAALDHARAHSFERVAAVYIEALELA
jgi:glycosyltransferase involved in cell wall biosynthesis